MPRLHRLFPTPVPGARVTVSRCLGLCLAGLLSGCGGFGGAEEKEPEEESRTAPRLVGTIASVPRDQGFVLVEGFGEWRLGEGLLLSSVGEQERRASLKITGERMGRYAAADILSGQVESGDRVYARPMPEPPPEEQEFSQDGEGAEALEPLEGQGF